MANRQKPDSIDQNTWDSIPQQIGSGAGFSLLKGRKPVSGNDKNQLRQAVLELDAETLKATVLSQLEQEYKSIDMENNGKGAKKRGEKYSTLTTLYRTVTDAQGNELGDLLEVVVGRMRFGSLQALHQAAQVQKQAPAKEKKQPDFSSFSYAVGDDYSDILNHDSMRKAVDVARATLGKDNASVAEITKGLNGLAVILDKYTDALNEGLPNPEVGSDAEKAKNWAQERIAEFKTIITDFNTRVAHNDIPPKEQLATLVMAIPGTAGSQANLGQAVGYTLDIYTGVVVDSDLPQSLPVLEASQAAANTGLAELNAWREQNPPHPPLEVIGKEEAVSRLIAAFDALGPAGQNMPNYNLARPALISAGRSTKYQFLDLREKENYVNFLQNEATDREIVALRRAVIPAAKAQVLTAALSDLSMDFATAANSYAEAYGRLEGKDPLSENDRATYKAGFTDAVAQTLREKTELNDSVNKALYARKNAGAEEFIQLMLGYAKSVGYSPEALSQKLQGDAYALSAPDAMKRLGVDIQRFRPMGKAINRFQQDVVEKAQKASEKKNTPFEKELERVLVDWVELQMAYSQSYQKNMEPLAEAMAYFEKMGQVQAIEAKPANERSEDEQEFLNKAQSSDFNRDKFAGFRIKDNLNAKPEHDLEKLEKELDVLALRFEEGMHNALTAQGVTDKQSEEYKKEANAYIANAQVPFYDYEDLMASVRSARDTKVEQANIKLGTRLDSLSIPDDVVVAQEEQYAAREAISLSITSAKGMVKPGENVKPVFPVVFADADGNIRPESYPMLRAYQQLAVGDSPEAKEFQSFTKKAEGVYIPYAQHGQSVGFGISEDDARASKKKSSKVDPKIDLDVSGAAVVEDYHSVTQTFVDTIVNGNLQQRYDELQKARQHSSLEDVRLSERAQVRQVLHDKRYEYGENPNQEQAEELEQLQHYYTDIVKQENALAATLRQRLKHNELEFDAIEVFTTAVGLIEAENQFDRALETAIAHARNEGLAPLRDTEAMEGNPDQFKYKGRGRYERIPLEAPAKPLVDTMSIGDYLEGENRRRKGNLTENDWDKPFELYQQASEQGDARALVAMARIYEEGVWKVTETKNNATGEMLSSEKEALELPDLEKSKAYYKKAFEEAKATQQGELADKIACKLNTFAVADLFDKKQGVESFRYNKEEHLVRLRFDSNEQRDAAKAFFAETFPEERVEAGHAGGHPLLFIYANKDRSIDVLAQRAQAAVPEVDRKSAELPETLLPKEVKSRIKEDRKVQASTLEYFDKGHGVQSFRYQPDPDDRIRLRFETKEQRKEAIKFFEEKYPGVEFEKKHTSDKKEPVLYIKGNDVLLDLAWDKQNGKVQEVSGSKGASLGL